MENQTINYYNKSSIQLVNKYESADVSEVQTLLLKTFKQKFTLLEIGIGSGRDISFMIKNNYNVIGIDGSINMIEEAKQIHPELKEKIFHRTLSNYLEFDIDFDGIYSIATLMHLSKSKLEKVILNIYNLLNNNGIFFMSVSLFRDDIDKNGIDKKGRFFLLLSFEQWLDILENVGFKILETKTNTDGLNRGGIEWLTLVVQRQY